MDRLKPAAHNYRRLPDAWFTFQYGSIKASEGYRRRFDELLFTFQYGSIKASSPISLDGSPLRLHSNMDRLKLEEAVADGYTEIVYIPIWID